MLVIFALLFALFLMRHTFAVHYRPAPSAPSAPNAPNLCGRQGMWLLSSANPQEVTCGLCLRELRKPQKT